MIEILIQPYHLATWRWDEVDNSLVNCQYDKHDKPLRPEVHQICQPCSSLNLWWVCSREAETDEADNEVADAKPLKNTRHSKFAEGDPAGGVEDESEEKELHGPHSYCPDHTSSWSLPLEV